MAMDGRIVGVTEDLTRRLFHLNPSYETTKCSANNKNVSIEMSNGIIPVAVKYPRLMIDDILQGEALPEDVIDKCLSGDPSSVESDDEQEEQDLEDNTETEEEDTSTEEVKEDTKKKSKTIKRRKK